MIVSSSHTIPQTASCPLCHQAGARRLFFSKDRIHNLPGTFGLFRCAACHAIFIQPWLTADELAGYYPKEYGRYRYSRSLEKNKRGRWYRLVRENYYGYPRSGKKLPSALSKPITFALALVMAKGVIPYHGEGRILDVGCGGGSYLYRLRQWGWDSYGVEPSESGIKQARALGLEVRHGMLADARFPDAFFDVVRLSHVLEHLPNPKETFREINRILKPQGLVYLTVPNTRSLAFSLFKENWYALDAPRHVISYCPQTLQTLCDSTGFEIADINFKAGPFNFVRSVKYFFEEKGENWPERLKQMDWQRNKLVRRTLKPFFFVVDGLGYGDFLHAVLKKSPQGRFTFATIQESHGKKLATQTT